MKRATAAAIAALLIWGATAAIAGNDATSKYRKRDGFFGPERITVLHYCLDVREYSRSLHVKRGSWSNDHVTLTCRWLPDGPSS